MVRARVRRHRWHAKILKARDPVVVSLGWRRFQTAPIFSTEDQDGRHRYLKYTPEHMHCEATFAAPGGVAPNAPLVGFHSLDATASFRACVGGVVVDVGAQSAVVKKLKLQGVPYRVERNTAFLDGLFGSSLEAARFEGAKLATVSGIRGAVKKALASDDRPGAVRATFEDKILMSDIVVCRLWVPVEPPDFCAPLATHLEPDARLPMRTVAQVRRQDARPLTVNLDSVYGARPIDRQPRKFAPHSVPNKLLTALPFASKPANHKPQSKRGYLARRTVVADVATRRASKLVQALNTIRNHRARHKADAAKLRNTQRARLQEAQHRKALPAIKARAKRVFAIQGAQQARKRAKFGSGFTNNPAA